MAGIINSQRTAAHYKFLFNGNSKSLLEALARYPQSNVSIYLLSALARYKSLTSVALAIALVTHFLGIASALSSKLDFLKYLSPFKYVDAVDILTRVTIPADYLLLIAIINVTAITLTYIIYQRKDFAVLLAVHRLVKS